MKRTWILLTLFVLVTHSFSGVLAAPSSGPIGISILNPTKITNNYFMNIWPLSRCFNDRKDYGENGVDCGGSCLMRCAAPSVVMGDPCRYDGECITGICDGEGEDKVCVGCRDSDPENDPTVGGELDRGNRVAWQDPETHESLETDYLGDTCLDGATVREYFCDDKGNLDLVDRPCPADKPYCTGYGMEEVYGDLYDFPALCQTLDIPPPPEEGDDVDDDDDGDTTGTATAVFVEFIEWEIVFPEDRPTEADHEMCTLDEAPPGVYFWEIPSAEDPGTPVRHMSRCVPDEGEYTIQYLNCNTEGRVTSITTAECTSGICDNETGTCVIPSCTDEDGGENPDTAGAVVAIDSHGTRRSGADWCASSDMTLVLEYSCNELELTSRFITCDENEICLDGACRPDSEIPSSCTDSDGGRDETITGEVDYTNPDGTHRTSQDFCTSTQTAVYEFYCNDTSYAGVVIPCESGYCLDGECRPASENPSSCMDTDGGQNPEVRGWVDAVHIDGTDDSYLDSCSSDNTAVIEWYCLGTESRSIFMACPSGYCRSGECRPLEDSPAYCLDSDGGRYKNIPGEVDYVLADGSFRSGRDQCSTDHRQVNEHYCSGVEHLSAWTPCEEDEICLVDAAGAACHDRADDPSLCIDHDGGLDASIPSFVESVNIDGEESIHMDGCNSTHTSVAEYYCDGNDWHMNFIACAPEDICLGGECVPVTCSCHTIEPVVSEGEDPEPRTTVGLLYGECTEHTDYCDFDEDGVKKLFRLGCSDDNSIVVESIEACPSGTACVNGVCR